jgi:alpha-tubulin suppressor-like RCC1 family protein
MFASRNSLFAKTAAALANLFSWGDNTYGALGLGNTTNQSSPVAVGTGSTWYKIAAGYAHTVATQTDGTLWSWGGIASFGQLGHNNTISLSSPVQVGALTTWSKIACGRWNTMAIKTDGTLWGWGSNATGQLGIGNITNRSSPVQVGALTTWLSVACGIYWTLATKTDGTLWTWGKNNVGQLGLSNTDNRSSPVQVGALTTWLEIAGGYEHTIAVKTDGTLWTWGSNGVGQLGIENIDNRSSPVQVGALTSWYKISGGNDSGTFATKTDGTLWVWGFNGQYQLGTGNTTNYSSPKQVGSDTNWLKVSTPVNSHALAIKTNNTLWGWGRNSNGDLGQGNTTTFYSNPVQIGALATWSNAVTGLGFSIANTE